MTIRYVGKGGSDGEDGLSWANRKLTLNGVEDTPVEAGDTVYVGPGIYRELLTVDIDGTNGNPITYIADVAGENTDGIGGIVRITGSDDDTQTANDRGRCINMSGDLYRTFRGFYFDEIDATGTNPTYIMVSDGTIICTDIIIEDCVFGPTYNGDASVVYGIYFDMRTAGAIDYEVRNCIFLPGGANEGVFSTNVTGTKSAGTSVIENCLFIRQSTGIYMQKTYNWYIRNCTFLFCWFGAWGIGLTTEQNYVYDCLFMNCENAISENGVDTMTEDYNLLCAYNSSVNEGANTLDSYLPIQPPILKSGYCIPWDWLSPTNWNLDVYTQDTSGKTIDLYGIDRPGTGSGKITRGAIQFKNVARDGSVYRTSPSSMKMEDNTKHIFNIPVDGDNTYRITVYVNRETNYAGTNPQIVVKSASQSDVVVTDSGSSGSWNKLTATFTTGSADRFIQIELRSNNTASTGDYQVNFDELSVKGIGTKISSLKWITNEIPIFAFELAEILDPWITSSIPIPGTGPVILVGPFPTFLRQ